MKRTTSLITILLAAFLIVFSCKKKNEPIPGDTVSMSDLSSELTPLTPTVTTTGGSTTGGSTTGGSTTGTPSTISWMFWTKSAVLNAAGGTIFIYVDGEYVGFITSSYTSGPSCGATGCVTTAVPPGSHTWYAEAVNQTRTWGTPFNPLVSTVSATCSRMEIN